MKQVYEFAPGIAALLCVRGPGLDKEKVPVVFLGQENGVVVGNLETPLAAAGWPMEVQAQITAHFDRVFSLPHETWKSKEPSPRATYCASLHPWQIEIDVPDTPT